MSTIALLFALACSSGGTGDTSPEAIASVADAIAADPSHADDALAAAGLDRAAFDAALYDIAADAKLSRRYLDARE